MIEVPPEILDSLWALAPWIAVVLLIPKRHLRSLAARMTAVASGDRLHVVSPPGNAHSVGSTHSRFWPLLGTEAPRALELGVPLWLASVMAEILGTAHRQEIRAGWDRTTAGLVAAHLRRQMSHRELHKRLLELGQPLPASKAQRAVRRTYTTPPMAWLRESQLAQSANSDGNHQEPLPTIPETAPQAQTKLEVQTLGTLRVNVLGEDLTAKLLRRPSAAFMWQYALVHTICSPHRPLSREWLAREMYADVDGETGRTRLRHQIYNMQQVLQGALLRSLGLEAGGNITFDLNACAVDAVRILELAHRLEADRGLLSPPDVAQISTAVDASSGELLPDWEDLEQSVTGGRGTAGQAVHDLRRRVQGARVALLAALGDHYVAVRDPARAAGLYEEALALRPERPDLATRLASALDSSGQQRRADEIRRSYLGRA